jgi:hypothetical protein
MSCQEHLDAIGELVDGGLEGDAAKHLERHLAECAGCRELSEDLLRLRQAASSLPPITPPERVWTELKRRLEAEQAPAYHRWFALPLWRPALALAAVLTLVVGSTVGVRWFVSEEDPAVHPGRAAVVQSVETELRLAEQHYERAIAGLEEIARAERDGLDPVLASTLDANLAIIDDAIKESREAIKAHPTNRLAQESLFEAFRRKVTLLQDTILLINEMRKGNQAEAARIIQDFNKS